MANTPPKAATTKSIKQVEKLFKQAVGRAQTLSTAKALSEAKLFEIYVLSQLLLHYKHRNLAQRIVPSSSKDYYFAGGPCFADRQKFTCFYMYAPGAQQPVAEAWVSLQVRTLSSHCAGVNSIWKLGARHEIDVGFFEPFLGKMPDHDKLLLGASCKHVTTFSKAMLREALGMRRETAYYKANNANLAPWAVNGSVPADPASPILLFSSDMRCVRYQYPADQLGVYVAHLRFPI